MLIHLKCWIRIRILIRIHSSGVVDPWHFGMDPDPYHWHPDPAFRHWLTRWQQKYVVFFHIFSLITFCRYPVHSHPFYKSQNNKNQGFSYFFACCWQDPILYKMLTNPEGPKTYGSGSTTMIFYVKEILSGGVSIWGPWNLMGTHLTVSVCIDGFQKLFFLYF